MSRRTTKQEDNLRLDRLGARRGLCGEVRAQLYANGLQLFEPWKRDIGDFEEARPFAYHHMPPWLAGARPR
jgi:hypothetical protein